MNRDIKLAVRNEITRRGITQRQLASDLDMTHQYLAEMLNLDRNNVPKRWQQLFDALDLELIVRSKIQNS